MACGLLLVVASWGAEESARVRLSFGFQETFSARGCGWFPRPWLVARNTPK